MGDEIKLVVWRVLLVLGAVLIFEGVVRARWIDPFFMASPVQAAEVLWSQVISGAVLTMIVLTLHEIGLALLISTIVGLCLGFLLWRYRVLGAGWEMLLAALFASPIILLYPLFLVIFGRTSGAIIALSALFGSIPITINTKSAFDHVNPILVQVGSSMNLSRRQMFRHILIPAVAPAIFSGFRLGLTYILKSVLGLEYVVQVGGIGMWISEAAFRFEVGEVYAGLLGALLLSVGFLYAINRTEGWIRR
jgi:NitT/TauT family transport system permease protein